MRKRAIILYSVISYLIFFITFLYFTGFLLNRVVDKGIDTGAASSQALLVDLGLIALFGVQHSVMARQGFKRWWRRFLPGAAERSTYVLTSSLLLLAIVRLWQPMPAVIWHIDSPILQAVLYVLFAAGLVLVSLSTFLMNHFEFFGLEQAYRALNDLPMPEPGFRMPLFYRVVRHPMQLGFLMMFWITPHMSVSHLLFAVGMSIFIFIGLHFEERDLVQRFGNIYRQYRAQTPLLLPIPTRQLRQIAIHQIQNATQILGR